MNLSNFIGNKMLPIHDFVILSKLFFTLQQLIRSAFFLEFSRISKAIDIFTVRAYAFKTVQLLGSYSDIIVIENCEIFEFQEKNYHSKNGSSSI